MKGMKRSDSSSSGLNGTLNCPPQVDVAVGEARAGREISLDFEPHPAEKVRRHVEPRAADEELAHDPLAGELPLTRLGRVVVELHEGAELELVVAVGRLEIGLQRLRVDAGHEAGIFLFLRPVAKDLLLLRRDLSSLPEDPENFLDH